MERLELANEMYNVISSYKHAFEEIFKQVDRIDQTRIQMQWLIYTVNFVSYTPNASGIVKS